jgi:hypothetical protein
MRLRNSVESAERILIDTISGHSSKVGLQRRPGCPGCGFIPENAKLLSASRMIGEISAFQWPADALITLSEPVLVGYSVRGSKQKMIFKRASEYDDTFPDSVSHEPESVELEIRDQFAADEFFARFGKRKIPTKFAIVSDQSKAFVIEFRG